MAGLAATDKKMAKAWTRPLGAVGITSKGIFDGGEAWTNCPLNASLKFNFEGTGGNCTAAIESRSPPNRGGVVSTWLRQF